MKLVDVAFTATARHERANYYLVEVDGVLIVSR